MTTEDQGHEPATRLRLADHYDAELQRHNERLVAATGIGPADRVLDVGCGAGQSTRDAARDAVSGSALGVDISEPMLERARRRTMEEGLDNVAYELGDAQVHRFAPAQFDTVVSRFGTMFFADPVAAFTNIAGASRPGGRLVMMVWQRLDRNEWATAIRDSLAAGRAAHALPATSPDPFSLADPGTVESILAAAGLPRSPSPTSTNRSTTARTPPPPTISCSTSSWRRTCSPAWTQQRQSARWRRCATPSPHTRPATACCFAREPGSSPLAAR